MMIVATYIAPSTAHMPATSAERLREPSASSAITRYSPHTTRIVTATVRASATDRSRSLTANR